MKIISHAVLWGYPALCVLAFNLVLKKDVVMVFEKPFMIPLFVTPLILMIGYWTALILTKTKKKAELPILTTISIILTAVASFWFWASCSYFIT